MGPLRPLHHPEYKNPNIKIYQKAKQSMKKIILALTAWLMLSLPAAAQVNGKPFVVPELTQWAGTQGTLTPSGSIVVRSAQLQALGRQFAADYELLTGHALAVKKGKPAEGDFVLQLTKDKELGQEGYRLDIADRITLTANTAKGAFWGTRTLLQMSEQHTALPKGRATDIPQYKMRGFMIDVGRKFVPMSYLRDLVKMMAYYKMNALQIHLNDNGFRQFFDNDWMKTSAAFRLESNTYPGLTAKDGSYTKREFVDLQKEAEQLQVEIIPEIDAPAHVLAFTHYMPELGSKKYGMDHFDLSNPKVYDFMDGLFKEYVGGKDPVFRGPRVNIGTDEYSNADQEVVEQFRAFTDRYLALMQQYGKQPMIWGSLTHAKGTTPIRHENVLMGLWSEDYANPTEMKKLGFRLLSIPDGLVYIVPAAGYYYDYLNCKYLYDNWTPAVVGSTRFEEQDPSLEGGMFAVWNDHYGNGISTKDIHDRVFPALQTIAVKCWTGRHTSLPYNDFDAARRLLHEAPGVNQAGQLPTASFTIARVEAGKPLAGLPTAAGYGPVTEAGYGNSVSFDVDCRPESLGTVLLESPNSTFYLSTPGTGRLGFARDGYLNSFNYKLPESGKVSIRIEMTPRETRLFVNGKRREVLGEQTAYVLHNATPLQTMPDAAFHTSVFLPGAAIHYQRTLFFPLQHAGNFKSTVTGLTVAKM